LLRIASVVAVAAAIACVGVEADGQSRTIGGQRQFPGAGYPPNDRPEPNHVLQAEALSTPTDLTSTTNPQVCSQHGGGFGAGLACKAELGTGAMALVWRQSSGGGILGYHIYRVDRGRAPVADQVNGPEVTFKTVPSPPSGACYAVSAFSAVGESGLSSAYCPGGGSTLQTVALRPRAVMTSFQQRSDDQAVIRNEGDSGKLWVGYNYNTTKAPQPIGDSFWNDVYRGGLWFDLGAVGHRRIVSARLRLTVDSAWVWSGSGAQIMPSRGDYPTDHHSSCVAKIATGIDYWWNHADPFTGSVVFTPGLQNGPDVAWDVTPIVAAWANGEPNFGFVLEGEEENLAAFTEKGCATRFNPASAALEIQYQ
jgi:hypothetical protein